MCKTRDRCGSEVERIDGPAFRPVLSSVSATISSRTLLKSKNFSPGRCSWRTRGGQLVVRRNHPPGRARLTNSAHSSGLLSLSLVGLEPSSSLGSPPTQKSRLPIRTFNARPRRHATESLTVSLVRLGRRRPVDQLEDEWTTRDDTGSSREKVAPDNVFEDGRLSGTLGTDDGDLRQVDGRSRETTLRERVLEQVDRLDQLRVHLEFDFGSLELGKEGREGDGGGRGESGSDEE